MIFFYLNNLKLKFITYFILTIYIFVNLALIFSTVIGKSSDQIRSFLVERDILLYKSWSHNSSYLPFISK